MTRAITPSPAEVRDALEVAALGGDLARLAAVCSARASTMPEPGRTRLHRVAAAMRWAVELIEASDAP